MVPLSTQFEDRTFRYTQVEREGMVAIFCQTHKASSCERYEVVKIRIEAEHTWPNGSVSPEREAYPGANSWGTLAWTCFTFPETQELAAQLRERTTAQAS